MTILGQKKLTSIKKDFVKSIDELFLKLELAYHYQFYKVFGTDQRLKEGKKLWAISLKEFSPETILKSVENVISSQSFLPTLTDLVKACRETAMDDGFPSAEDAFDEAKRSFQPRKEFNWSHPIIFFAGKKIGWNTFNEKDSNRAYKIFVKIYSSLKKQSKAGKKFVIESDYTSDEQKPLNKQLLEKLRKKHKV